MKRKKRRRREEREEAGERKGKKKEKGKGMLKTGISKQWKERKNSGLESFKIRKRKR